MASARTRLAETAAGKRSPSSRGALLIVGDELHRRRLLGLLGLVALFRGGGWGAKGGQVAGCSRTRLTGAPLLLVRSRCRCLLRTPTGHPENVAAKGPRPIPGGASDSRPRRPPPPAGGWGPEGRRAAEERLGRARTNRLTDGPPRGRGACTPVEMLLPCGACTKPAGGCELVPYDNGPDRRSTTPSRWPRRCPPPAGAQDRTGTECAGKPWRGPAVPTEVFCRQHHKEYKNTMWVSCSSPPPPAEPQESCGAWWREGAGGSPCDARSRAK